MGAPEPILAKFNEAEEVVYITFSHELRWTNPLDLANWLVLYGVWKWTVVAAFCASSMVALRLTKGDAGPPVDRVSFAPPPFDVIGQNGVPVEWFTGYPLLPA